MLPVTVGAQSSQFGARGLGFPGRSLAVRAIGRGGAFGLFHPESSQNPAAVVRLVGMTAVFSITEGFRKVKNPAGTASVRDTRFPQLIVAGPAERITAAGRRSFSKSPR